MNPHHMLSRNYFPSILYNPNLIYMDNASTTQTHQMVTNAIMAHYTMGRGNPGRGGHRLAEKTFDEIELAREKVAMFFGVPSHQVIFTKGATQSLNWVAHWYRTADTVYLARDLHNAAIAPWLAQGRTFENRRLQWLDDHDTAQLPKGSLAVLSLVNNVDGGVFHGVAHSRYGHADICLDVSQATRSAISSLAISQLSERTTGKIWAACSAHKMFGPTGVGMLYYSGDWDDYEPIELGGGTYIFPGATNYRAAPGSSKHECGTLSSAAIIGFGVAAEICLQHYTSEVDLKVKELVEYLKIEIEDSSILSEHFEIFSRTAAYAAPFVTLSPKVHHSNDISSLLGHTDLAVRCGFMCAHLYAKSINEMGLVRFSLAPYNAVHEVDRAVEILEETIKRLSKA